MLLNEIKQIFELDDTPFTDALGDLGQNLRKGWDRGKGREDKEPKASKIDAKFKPLADKILFTKAPAITASFLTPSVSPLDPPTLLEEAIDAVTGMRWIAENVMLKRFMGEIKDLQKLKDACTALHVSIPWRWMIDLKNHSIKPGSVPSTDVETNLTNRKDQIHGCLMDSTAARTIVDRAINNFKLRDQEATVTPAIFGSMAKVYIETYGTLIQRLDKALLELKSLLPAPPTPTP